MHDCNNFKDKMVDLLFECADGDERWRLLAEVAACKTCDSLCRSMSETLAVFDQVTRTAEPEESYWIGYENRLQAQLTEHARPKQNLFAPLLVKDLLARLPIALRVAFACSGSCGGAVAALQSNRKNEPARAHSNRQC